MIIFSLIVIIIMLVIVGFAIEHYAHKIIKELNSINKMHAQQRLSEMDYENLLHKYIRGHYFSVFFTPDEKKELSKIMHEQNAQLILSDNSNYTVQEAKLLSPKSIKD